MGPPAPGRGSAGPPTPPEGGGTPYRVSACRPPLGPVGGPPTRPPPPLTALRRRGRHSRALARHCSGTAACVRRWGGAHRGRWQGGGGRGGGGWARRLSTAPAGRVGLCRVAEGGGLKAPPRRAVVPSRWGRQAATAAPLHTWSRRGCPTVSRLPPLPPRLILPTLPPHDLRSRPQTPTDVLLSTHPVEPRHARCRPAILPSDDVPSSSPPPPPPPPRPLHPLPQHHFPHDTTTWKVSSALPSPSALSPPPPPAPTSPSASFAMAAVAMRVPRGVPALLQAVVDEDELSSLLLLQLRRRGATARRAASTDAAEGVVDATNATAAATAVDARTAVSGNSRSYDGPCTHPSRTPSSRSRSGRGRPCPFHGAAAAAATAVAPNGVVGCKTHPRPHTASSSPYGSSPASSESEDDDDDEAVAAALRGDPGVAMDATGYLTPRQLTRLVKLSSARQANRDRTVQAAESADARHRVRRHFARRRLAAGTAYGAPAGAPTHMYRTMLEANHRRQQQYLERRTGGGADGSDTSSGSGGDGPGAGGGAATVATAAAATPAAATSPATSGAASPPATAPRRQGAAATERLAKRLLPLVRRTNRA